MGDVVTRFTVPATALAILLGFVMPAAAAPTTVIVDMDNMPDGSQVMRLDRAEVPAGKVRFSVTNRSDKVVHEFLVVRTALMPDRFPMNRDGTRVDERKLKGLRELGDLKPGQSGTLTLALRPGHYVLFCNETGHFMAGMHAELAVAGKASAQAPQASLQGPSHERAAAQD